MVVLKDLYEAEQQEGLKGFIISLRLSSNKVKSVLTTAPLLRFRLCSVRDQDGLRNGHFDSFL